MINSKELKQRAREQLRGRYWGYLLPVVTFFLIPMVANSFTNIAAGEGFAEEHRLLSVVLPLMSLLIFLFVSNPMQVGLAAVFLRGAKGEPDANDLFLPFKKKYFRTVKNILFVILKILCAMLGLIIPGVLRMLDYAMVPFILAENPMLDDEDVCEESKAMMRGNRWRLIKLLLSFWLWLILAAATLGLGFLFLWPYLHAALAQFYLEVKQEKEAE